MCPTSDIFNDGLLCIVVSQLLNRSVPSEHNLGELSFEHRQLCRMEHDVVLLFHVSFTCWSISRIEHHESGEKRAPSQLHDTRISIPLRDWGDELAEHELTV